MFKDDFSCGIDFHKKWRMTKKKLSLDYVVGLQQRRRMATSSCWQQRALEAFEQMNDKIQPKPTGWWVFISDCQGCSGFLILFKTCVEWKDRKSDSFLDPFLSDCPQAMVKCHNWYMEPQKASIFLNDYKHEGNFRSIATFEHRIQPYWWWHFLWLNIM